VHDRVPQLDGRVLEISACGARGVVHQHIDAAEFLDREADDPAAGVDVSQISGDPGGVLVDRSGDLARLRLVQAVDDEMRAERDKVLGDPAPDARRRACDERYFLIERCHRYAANLWSCVRVFVADLNATCV